MCDPVLGDSLSNPCLLELDDTFRLYFSASLAYIDDCGFCEPRYIAAAESNSLSGEFIPRKRPLIDPAGDELAGVLGAGSIKVIRMDDGFIGLQNKIYRDAKGSSRSAIFILRSEDGFTFRSARALALVAPDCGWKSSHVYACDCRFDEGEGVWYLYFNARDGWRISEGMERIGRITGSL